MTTQRNEAVPPVPAQRDLARARALACRCAGLLAEKKLQDIQIFQVAETIQITDFFLIASGLNPRHIRTAGDFLARELKKEGIRHRGVEGHHDGRWILIDLDEVVVHLFLPESRRYYDLELLWGDCPRLEWSVPECSAGTRP